MANTNGPDRTIFGEPSIRAYQNWSPEKIVAAETAADAGNLRFAADFTDAMLADARLSSVLGQRIDALLGCELEFDASAGDGRRRKRALRALEAEEDFYDSFPESELKQLLAWGIMLGVAVAEIRWVNKGSRVLPTIEVKHPRNLRFDFATRTWRLLTVQLEDDSEGAKAGGQKEVVIDPAGGKWILFTPYGSMRPWAWGAWRSCSKPFLLKRFAISDLGRHLEILAGGIFVGGSPEGATKKDRDAYAADISNIGAETFIAPPPGYTLGLVESKAQAEAAFMAAIDMANLEFTIAIARHNLVAEVQGGSKAATETGRAISLGATKFDNGSLSTCLHDQALIWWADFNFGDSDLAPWVRWKIEPPEDLKSKADMLSSLATSLATFATAGARVDVPALLEQFDIPLLEQVDTVDPGATYFAYDYQAGVVTYNEARAKKGLPPASWGDEPISSEGPSQFRPPPPSLPSAPSPGSVSSTSPAATPATPAPSADAAPGPSPVPKAARATDVAIPLPPLELRVAAFTNTPDLATLLAQAEVDARAWQSFKTRTQRADSAQRYVSDVAANAARAAASALRPNIDAVVDAVDVQGSAGAPAKDHADAIRKRLVAAYRAMQPTELASLTEGATTVTHLAGRVAVHQATKG